MSAFLNPLVLVLISDSDARPLFSLVNDFSYKSDRFNRVFTAPAGFQTDGPSIPQIAMSFTGYPGMRAAVIHDYYCTEQHGLVREDADLLFHEALLVCGVGSATAQAMYDAVAGYTRQLRAQANQGGPSYIG